MAVDSDLTPYGDVLVDEENKMSSSWQLFFRTIDNLIKYIKKEQVFTLVNNQAVAANITGLSFDFRYTSQAIIEYLVQRVTSSVELVESGRIAVIYLPDSNTWNIDTGAYVSAGITGVTFSITSAGQIQYETTNEAGTAVISRMVYRVRELAGKTNIYSKLG